MPRARYSEIADQIAAVLNVVANIGHVHTYQRNLKTREQIDAEFFDEEMGRHNGWTISRESFNGSQSTNLGNTRLSVWKLRGFMAVQDSAATEKLFQQVIDDIDEAFTPQENLNETIELVLPIQAVSIGYTWLGKQDSGVFCHGAELTLQVQETYHS